MAARTWGDIRLQLTKFRPGLDQEVIDQLIHQAYEDILDDRPWDGLKYESEFVAPVVHRDGTISLTEGLNTVTGVSTNFTSAMTGRTFRLRAGTNARYIFTYVGASSGTLDRVWEEAAVSAVTYEIYQAVFELPAEVKYVTEVLNPHTLRPLQKKSQRELNEIDTARRLLATPRMWAPGIDTPHASPPVMHTLELYPAPVEAKGYPYVAQQATYSFDGSNTSDEPLPWISRGALIERCKALILEDEKDYNGAAIKERRFQDKLNRMGLVEAKRKGPRHLQLDPTWTSHYRARGFK